MANWPAITGVEPVVTEVGGVDTTGYLSPTSPKWDQGVLGIEPFTTEIGVVNPYTWAPPLYQGPNGGARPTYGQLQP